MGDYNNGVSLGSGEFKYFPISRYNIKFILANDQIETFSVAVVKKKKKTQHLLVVKLRVF